MKRYEVTIDRGSECYTISADNEDSAREIAMILFENNNIDSSYDYWVADIELSKD